MPNDSDIKLTGKELHNACLGCGAHCCKLGGVVATKDEVDAIIERGYPNHFVQIEDGVFGMDWRKKGTCAYLKEDSCTIYPVRPIGCRMFPVVHSKDQGVILVECPVAHHLSEKELEERKRILSNRPESITNASSALRKEHERELQIRSTKYGYRVL